MTPFKVYLYTNRNIVVFDESGEQLPDWQSAVDCYQLDQKKALELSKLAQYFYLQQWNTGATIELSRKEFQYLLGLRNRESDLAELEQKGETYARSL